MNEETNDRPATVAGSLSKPVTAKYSSGVFCSVAVGVVENSTQTLAPVDLLGRQAYVLTRLDDTPFEALVISLAMVIGDIFVNHSPQVSFTENSQPVNHLPLERIIEAVEGDRKSTRLNSSHANISYAVF